MMKTALIAFSLIVFCMVGCSGDQAPDSGPSRPQPVPTGDRMLSIDITETEHDNFANDFAVAKTAGMEVTTFSQNWNEIETSSENYYNAWLSSANHFYPPRGTAISLSIQVINTNQLEVPSDLVDTDFDHPDMINRFKRLLDFVFDEIPDVTLVSLSIGNEIDAYLGVDADLWAQYQTFYENVSAYARTKRSGLKVGAKTTFSEIVGAASSYIAALNSTSDLLSAES